MKIRWLQDVELECFDGIEDFDTGDSETKAFHAGEITDVEIVGYGERVIHGFLSEDNERPHFQFLDETVTPSVSMELWEEVEPEDEVEAVLDDERHGGFYPAVSDF